MQQNANQFETGDVKYNLIKRDKKKINRSPLTDARAISLGIKEKKNKKLSRWQERTLQMTDGLPRSFFPRYPSRSPLFYTEVVWNIPRILFFKRNSKKG